MSPATKWVLLEALLPLFGASLIYGFLGVARWLVTPEIKRVKWAWGEAFDTMGWLYGGVILAVQAGIRGYEAAVHGPHLVVVWICFVAAIACAILLSAAMMARGEDHEWKPPTVMLVSTSLLMIVIVVTAHTIQEVTLANGVDDVCHAYAEKTCS
ncbi:hypothetical protein PIN31115_01321 [Pandoraea iniqua]|uniref:Transmembrane protein n=1 Tax=Pandoraea iniqua TaxID=2508288 RepID=A0A5E4TD88_9BURK|nr:hypothetical protein [Pandoraea iniqua]VVD85242.1 hypothetical protein PIN31115_01321 [Pandoraea iniqua]